MSNSSESDSPQWSERGAEDQAPPPKRRRGYSHMSTQGMEGLRNDPPFRPLPPPYPTFSIFGPPQAPPTWHPYQLSYPPPPPQWYPVYPEYSAERMKPAYSRPSSGPSDAGPSRPPTAEPVEPADYGPIWPANYGPSRLANHGPSRPASHATFGTLDPTYENQSSHKGQQSNQPYGNTSLEGDTSDFMPLDTSTPSHASQGKKLCTRRIAKQPHIGASSDSDNSDEASSDEEGDTVGDFDPDNYYSSNSQFPKVVNNYIEKRFRRCIPREQRKKMLRDNPIPSTPAAKVPQVDDDIVAFLGQEFPHKLDKCLSKIQGTTVAVAAPLATLWANLIEQKLTGEAALIAADDVVETIQRSLSLLGNSINYISQARRDVIISKLETKKKGLAKIMRKASKSDLTDAKTELFGPTFRKVLKEKADTMSAFGKIAERVEQSTSNPNRFFRGGPSTSKYGSGRGRSTRPYTNLSTTRNVAQQNQPKPLRYFNNPSQQRFNKQRTQNQPKPRQ